jgi:hypothetical protein
MVVPPRMKLKFEKLKMNRFWRFSTARSVTEKEN